MLILYKKISKFSQFHVVWDTLYSVEEAYARNGWTICIEQEQ